MAASPSVHQRELPGIGGFSRRPAQPAPCETLGNGGVGRRSCRQRRSASRVQGTTDLRIGALEHSVDVRCRIFRRLHHGHILAPGFGRVGDGNEVAGEKIIERLRHGKLTRLRLAAASNTHLDSSKAAPNPPTTPQWWRSTTGGAPARGRTAAASCSAFCAAECRWRRAGARRCSSRPDAIGEFHGTRRSARIGSPSVGGGDVLRGAAHRQCRAPTPATSSGADRRRAIDRAGRQVHTHRIAPSAPVRAGSPVRCRAGVPLRPSERVVSVADRLMPRLRRRSLSTTLPMPKSVNRAIQPASVRRDEYVAGLQVLVQHTDTVRGRDRIDQAAKDFQTLRFAARSKCPASAHSFRLTPPYSYSRKLGQGLQIPIDNGDEGIVDHRDSRRGF